MCKGVINSDKQAVQFFILFFTLAGFDFKLILFYAFVTYVINQTRKGGKKARFLNTDALLGPTPQLKNF